MKKSILFSKQKNDTVKCKACKMFCTINEGNTGICGVRQNRNGELYLLVYGRAFSANIDPVEKKPLFHFFPREKVFSFGTIGCNFACQFCQNWDMSQMTRKIKAGLIKSGRLEDMHLEVSKYGYKLSPEKVIEYCIKNSIKIIAYTYNEPSIFFEYAFDTAKLAKKKGIKNIFVSNGYTSNQAIDKIAPYLDAINIDLKFFQDESYKKFCNARLQPVLEGIKYYYEKGIWVELTTLIIPDENDSEKELTDIAEFIKSISKDIPWHITRFSPAYKMLEKTSTAKEMLEKAYQIGKKVGLNYIFVGNIPSRDLQSSFCPNCGEILIERNWHEISIKNLDKKRSECKNCSEKIVGRFN